MLCKSRCEKKVAILQSFEVFLDVRRLSVNCRILMRVLRKTRSSGEEIIYRSWLPKVSTLRYKEQSTGIGSSIVIDSRKTGYYTAQIFFVLTRERSFLSVPMNWMRGRGDVFQLRKTYYTLFSRSDDEVG